MNVAAGTRLGPYEIVSRIGAGGMGEVWRARDTRLDRSVAVKVLSPAMAGDSSLRVRMEREGKVISQLSHPHICTLFDVGDGYLVMELLEGETLAERISRGPLPVTEVLRIGEQMAQALDAAHRHGIVHRDLKPGNIMLTRSGVKLLDFGLARVTPAAINPDDETQQHHSLTEEGAVVGTLQYMAPEQLDGLNADTRTDIFALGAVLYEMATGRRPFSGATRSSVIMSIASADPPPMAQLQTLAPPRLEQLIRACLAKRPDDRMQSAHDVALELRWIAAADAPATVARRSSTRERIAWSIAALLALLLGGAIIERSVSEPTAPSPIRFSISPPRETNIFRAAAVSPDGTRIVFRAAGVDGSSSLWLRSLAGGEAKELERTGAVEFVFWSPDSRHIGFFSGGKLKRLDTADGTIRTIYEKADSVPGGATWNKDGVIVFSPIFEGGLHRVAATGGEAVPLAGKDKPNHAWPSFLPDGRHFLYMEMANGGGAIKAGSLDSSESTTVVPLLGMHDFTPVYYGAGHLFYVRNQVLVAQPFDPDSLKTTGPPLNIDDSIDLNGPGRTPLSVSSNGTLVYRKAGPNVVSRLVIVDRTGKKLRTLEEPGPYTSVSVSPDGERLLLSHDGETESIWELDLRRGSSQRVTFEHASFQPVWQRDGKSFAYSAAVNSPPNVFLRRADGSTARLTHTTQQNYANSISPDGKYVVYTVTEPGRNWNLLAVTTTAPHVSVPLLDTQFGETDGTISPDGKWLAYSSNASGRWQIYVTTFPKPGRRWLVSTSAGCDNPAWSADGRELYYIVNSERKLYAVSIAAEGDDLRAERPAVLFELPSALWAPFPNGTFLTAERTLNPAAPPLSVVVNWRP